MINSGAYSQKTDSWRVRIVQPDMPQDAYENCEVTFITGREFLLGDDPVCAIISNDEEEYFVAFNAHHQICAIGTLQAAEQSPQKERQAIISTQQAYLKFRNDEVGGPEPLKKIAMPGAYSAILGGDSADDNYLSGIFLELANAGVVVDPNFTVDVINLHFDRDFLTETHQYDIVIVSHIPDPSSEMPLEQWNNGLKVMSEEFFRIGRLSSVHSPENWRDRIAASGAKIVATINGNPTDIHPGMLESKNYLTVQPCEDYVATGWSRYRPVRLSTGILASRAFLSHLPPSVGCHAKLGQSMFMAADKLKSGPPTPAAEF